MKKLNGYRCFCVVSFFLLGDIVNANYTVAGRQTWLVYIVASFLAIPFYKLCAYACAGGIQTRLSQSKAPVRFVVNAAIATTCIGILMSIYGQFSLFIKTYNDTYPSTAAVVFLMVVTCAYLSTLKGTAFARQAETAFVWIHGMFILALLVNYREWDLGNLMPFFSADLPDTMMGIAKAFAAPFVHGFAAIAFLSDKAEEKVIFKSSVWAALSSGVVLVAEWVKNVCIIGYELASKYTFPPYAVAGIQEVGKSGLGIENTLICALCAAYVVKASMLIRLSGECINGAINKKINITFLCVGVSLFASIIADKYLDKSIGMRWWTTNTNTGIVVAFGLSALILAVIRLKKSKSFDTKV